VITDELNKCLPGSCAEIRWERDKDKWQGGNYNEATRKGKEEMQEKPSENKNAKAIQPKHRSQKQGRFDNEPIKKRAQDIKKQEGKDSE